MKTLIRVPMLARQQREAWRAILLAPIPEISNKQAPGGGVVKPFLCF